jgi:hypothetical protein
MDNELKGKVRGDNKPTHSLPSLLFTTFLTYTFNWLGVDSIYIRSSIQLCRHGIVTNHVNAFVITCVFIKLYNKTR